MKVLAKDAKAGQWHKDRNGARILCVGGKRFVREVGDVFGLWSNEELTHLPDCTGWDWQPPKPEKKYRAFATWQEWWPHRDRWVRNGLDRIRACWFGQQDADARFKNRCVFLNDDGTDAEPFGVEVTQ